MIRPSSLFTVGFLLSFSAVFTIYLLSGYITSALKRVPKFIAISAASSVTATIGTAPILINYFNYVSLIGVLANLIIIPMAAVTIVLTLLSVFLGNVVGGLIAVGADQLIRMMNHFMQLIQNIPLAAVNIRNLPVVFIVLWYVLIFILSTEWRISRVTKRISAAVMMVVMTGILLIAPLSRSDTLSLYFFDVGQGDSLLIETSDDHHYMVDTGRAYAFDEIERYLLSDGIQLDGLFLTHSDDDHIGGYQKLVENGLVSHIYIAEADHGEYDFDSAITVDKVVRGDCIVLGSDTTMRILHPEAGISAANDNQKSLCMMIEYLDYRILLTGDIDDVIEQRLISLWQGC